jgi:hypothetical protein
MKWNYEGLDLLGDLRFFCAVGVDSGHDLQRFALIVQNNQLIRA